jgi:membrane-associated protease RseP (regulator of RpoE activity)
VQEVYHAIPHFDLTPLMLGSRIELRIRAVSEPAMKVERRAPLIWFIIGAVVVCAWCSGLSGVGGWIMGQDLARREARAEFATSVAANEGLPLLGVLVTRLDRTGPAARAGIQRGDAIIAINGTRVQDARDLHDQVRSYRSGDVVQLLLLRASSQENISVRLDPFPGDNRQPYLGIYFTARGDEPADL